MNKRAPSTVLVQAGKMEFVKVNAAVWDWRDIYHWLLTLRWPPFCAFLLGAHLTANCLFALLYLAGGDCISGMRPGSFSDAFFFSVETLATVGYGHMYPATLYGHCIATTEILGGMFGLAVMTGLIFVRFSRPTARLVFSESLVISRFDGKPTLMMRIANLRHQALAQADFRMVLIRNEIVEEGEEWRHFYPLTLHVHHVIMFPVALTIRHTIDEDSPLYGQSLEMLEKSDVRIIASIAGVDTVMQAPVQSQTDYTWRDIRFGHRFVEIYSDLDANRYSVDYGRLHDTEQVAPPSQ